MRSLITDEVLILHAYFFQRLNFEGYVDNCLFNETVPWSVEYWFMYTKGADVYR